MNITTKKLLYIVTAMLAAAMLVSSCSKEPKAKGAKQQAANGVNNSKTQNAKNPGAKAPKKGKKVSKADKTGVLVPADKNSLTVVRDGQYATLSWHIDTTGGNIDYINVLRSPTGVGKERKVAELKPGASSFKDCLPDENACWYSLKLFGKDGKFQVIGPVRVSADKAGSDRYVKLDEKYRASVTRTDYQATIKWSFPEDDYKVIDIVRYKLPVTEPFKGTGGAVSVVSSKEGVSQYNDTLKNPNEEYWYWFRIILNSGAIYYKGPVKAEYTRR